VRHSLGMKMKSHMVWMYHQRATVGLMARPILVLRDLQSVITQEGKGIYMRCLMSQFLIYYHISVITINLIGYVWSVEGEFRIIYLKAGRVS